MNVRFQAAQIQLTNATQCLLIIALSFLSFIFKVKTALSLILRLYELIKVVFTLIFFAVTIGVKVKLLLI